MTSRKIISPLLIIAFLFLFLQPVRSQILISILLGDKLNSGAIEFGLTGGLNRSYLFHTNNAKGLNHFNLGFYFDFRLKEGSPWYLYTGVLVKSEMGASKIDPYILGDEDLDSVMADGYINRYINYFKVPIAAKYKFKNNIFLLGGFQLALRHKARDEFTNSIYETDDIVYKHKTQDNYRRIDAGVTAGIGYKFRYGAMMNMGLRYYQGFVDIYKGDFKQDYGYDTNSSLYVFFEIPIGAKRNIRPEEETRKYKREQRKQAKNKE
jgi:hypothetical protein